ncbi:hypothetical protein [Thermoflavimicrobium dichotomicum]|uniref:Uncharacterized protein n=1 Tax=Thermoflavimicrobium dichotomicum TaxID=46223 RepID=A0A1I3QDM9_9BACL|nr:hypothetical protein [Thermoflavimicrobium dichotomicum]SFJ32233.1 hypothetical protein SAMN05421852_107130 [Thermoflavimicrobium dichotomicum]
MDEMKSMLTALLEGQRYLTARMDGMDHKIDRLTGEVTQLKEDVSILKQDVAGLKDDVNILKQDVAGLKDDVNILKQDVTGLKDDVNVLKQDVADLKVQVSNVEENMITKDDLKALSESMTEGFCQTAATLENAYQSIELLNSEQTIKNIKGIR